MDLFSLNQILFPLFILLILTSIIGYGILIDNIFLKETELNLKNLIFIKGLILIGSINIFVNLFYEISDLISIAIIIVGSILYIYFLANKYNKRSELIFIIFVSLLSFFYSFYSGVNDDFNYHYDTIKNFKNKNLFEILHHRNVSYNSHWLFLTSIFSTSIFTSSLFILSSLFYSISIYDYLNLTRNSINKQRNYLSIISFLVLIFFLGVLNQLKEFGTDIPGVIISIYVFIILIFYLFENKRKNTNRYFLIALLLCQFAFIIKITNVLIFLFLIFLLLNLKYNKKDFLSFLLICLIPLPWIFQNFIISGCLIWPLSFTCFYNADLAVHETYLIESFAKGDISTTMEVNNLNWIYIWFNNHSNKLIETYLVYLCLMIFPFVYIIFKEKYKFKFIINHLKQNFLDFNYLIIITLVLTCNLVWFFYAPAYRFGVFYNLSLIIICLLPIYLFIIKYNLAFITNYSKFVFIFICLYFVYENITRLDWYNKRYDIWPPIYKEKLLERKNI